ncbi:hypothetical protein TELCIR_17956 [Teladorsagia circumcincta]|uniref:FAD synthase middle domain-containing protein n=1 Tax=Teladorsagia circumcincta TaxID=45464 RepID=A0A2G9TRB7_TELCI|nr:hypothetical protein TELCIR_17956 [Teladorsagia circumcincta]
MFSETIYTSKDEVKIANQLAEIASKCDGVVDIGSYPVMSNTFFKTKLIVESESSESGQAVTDAIYGILEDAVVHYDEEPWVDTVVKFNRFRERELPKNPEYVTRLNDALVVIDDLLEQYPKFGPNVEIQGFHIMVEDQFPEATQFIIDAARKSPVEWTDPDWPRVLRVCPILPWSYRDNDYPIDLGKFWERKALGRPGADLEASSYLEADEDSKIRTAIRIMLMHTHK